MNRSFHPHPEIEGKVLVRIQLNDEELKTWVANAGLDAPPLGYRGYVRVSGNLMEYGLEKIPAGGAGAVTPPVGGDNLDGLSVAELQTKCGMKGIAYGKEKDKTALIQLLRAKGK